MPTVKATIEYDGTAYRGWQRQPHHPTIQSAVEDALARIIHMPVSVVAAGRTDAGVHAWGQVMSFRADKLLSPFQWRRALNALLPPDICIRQVEEVPDTFHARYSAKSKRYSYHILNRPDRSAIDRFRAWHLAQPLEISAMEEAAQACLGTFNFSSFQGSRTKTTNPICTIEQILFKREEAALHIHVQANRFLKHMVRAMVGTLVEIGQGKRCSSDMKNILRMADRRHGGKTAPPHGLYLVEVLY